MRSPSPLQVGPAVSPAGADEEGRASSASSPAGPTSFLNMGRPNSSSFETPGGAGGGAAAAGGGGDRDAQNKTSTRLAALIFFKGLFGAGLLALPGAFASVGLPLALLIFGLVSVICLGTMLMLLECRRLVREERGVWVESYEELAGEVFGVKAYRATQVVMSVLTLIYCSGFVIVITSSFAAVLPLSRPLIAAIVFPVLTALSWLPFMKDLWIVSIIGLVVYLVGVVGTTVWYSREHYHAPPDAMAWRWKGVPHFFGVAVYALEGINLTLPVSASMKSIRKPPFVMTLSVVGFAAVVAFYAGYAYAAGVGGGDCDIVTECLGDGGVVNTVRVALALSIIVTHPVYLIVASEIFERACFAGEDAEAQAVRQRIEADFQHFHEHVHEHMQERGNGRHGHGHSGHHGGGRVMGAGGGGGRPAATAGAARARPPCWLGGGLSDASKSKVLRTAEVALTCLVGGSVRSLGTFTSLVGATLVTFIGFLLPAAMWVELQRYAHASRAERLRTYGIAAVVIGAGLVAMVVGTVEGVRGLAHRGK